MAFLSALLSEGSIIDLDATFFIQFAIFWIAFFFLKSFVFAPIIKVIEAREEAIDGARDKAKAWQKEAEAAGSEFDDEMRKVRTSAGEERDKLRAEGEHLEQQMMSSVAEETSKALAEAQEDIAKQAKKLRAEVASTTPVLAREIAAKLLQREVQ